MSDDEPNTRGTEAARWQRVLLKLSGEAFAGPLEHGIHGPTVRAIAEDIVAAARQFNVDIAVVVGAGNIWRGIHGAGEGMDRAQADYPQGFAREFSASKSLLFPLHQRIHVLR